VTDEHHAPTVLAVHGLGDEATCVSNIVHVLWKPSDTRSPYRYQPRDVTRGTLEKIRARGKNCRPELTIECVVLCTHESLERSDRGCPVQRSSLVGASLLLVYQWISQSRVLHAHGSM